HALCRDRVGAHGRGPWRVRPADGGANPPRAAPTRQCPRRSGNQSRFVTDAPPSGHALDASPRPKPAPRGPRTRYIVARPLCIAAIAYLVFVGLGSNIVYFRTPTEA